MFDHAPDLDFARTGSKRVFLFLQGPSSPFFAMLADALVDRGHEVRRINICFGDQLFWKRPGAANYRGKIQNWPDFIGEYLYDEKITDIILSGDRRPHHLSALEKARALGVNCYVTDLGYIRPDWITLERDGMTSFSRFPTDPDLIRAIAKLVPEPDLDVSFPGSFFNMALWDVQHNLANVFLWPFYPHYKWHAIYHPLAEYAGWLLKLAIKSRVKHRNNLIAKSLFASKVPFYLFPLQLQTDYQLRHHSPYADQKVAIREVIKSFVDHAPVDTKLVIKVHPLDNGLERWRKFVGKSARKEGVQERIIFIDGGHLEKLIEKSSAVITINSTVGTTALRLGRPVIALGTAIFDIPGLTHQAGLDSFWKKMPVPDVDLWHAFVRVLVGTIQIKGGYYTKEALEAVVAGATERLDTQNVNEPNAYIDPPPRSYRLAKSANSVENARLAEQHLR